MTAVLSRRRINKALRSAAGGPALAVVDDFRKNEPKLESMMRPEMQSVLEDLGRRVHQGSTEVGGILMESEATPTEQQRIDAIIAASRLDTWKLARLKPMFEKHWQRAARMTIQTLERHDISPTLRDKIAEDILLKGGQRIGLVDIAGDTKRSLLKVINVGRELGLNPRKTASLIEQFVPAGRFTFAGKQYRSQMISRTETLSAVREASVQSYKYSKTVEMVIAFDGEEFDETCASRNGEVFTIEEAEMENGNTHPNCVLAWGPYT